MLARSLAFAFPAAAVLVIACTSLPSLSANTCGNGVVEPDHGEDCDSFGQGTGTACRPAGVIGACRFDCSGANVCPVGYGCGSGAICRAGTATFELVRSIPATNVQHLVASSFAGGADSLMIEGLDDVRVAFFDSAFGITQIDRISALSARAIVGHLTSEPYADLVLASSGGVDVWRGHADKSLTPVLYPSFPIPGPAYLIPVQALSKSAGAQLLVFGNSFGPGAPPGIARVSSNREQPALMFQMPQGPALLARDAVVGDLWEDPAQSPCDEFALAFKIESRVRVFTSCKMVGTTPHMNVPPSAADPGLQLTLPDVVLSDSSATVNGILLAHLNADSHLDLLVDTTKGMFAAYGVGNGTFHSTSPVPPPTQNGDGKALPFSFVIVNDPTGRITGFPLAAGNIDEIPAAPFSELVFPGGILFDVGAPPGAYAVALYSTQPWTAARIADFNGDGVGDVVAVTDTEIDFYKGNTSALLNPNTYTVPGAIGGLSLGDVDGDGVVDIVLRSASIGASGTATSGQDDVSILYGTQGGYPEPPALIGTLPTISQIAVAPYEAAIVNPLQAGTGIADLAVVSTDPSSTPQSQKLLVAAIAGRADRQLTSPFYLVDGADLTRQALAPLRFATGHFLTKDHEDVAALAVDPRSGLKQPSRLWLAPMTGDAQIHTDSIHLTDPPLPAGYDYGRAKMVAVDLDAPSGDGLDEVVVIVPPLVDATGAGLMLVARQKNGAFSVTSQNPIGVGSSTLRTWVIKIGDVNGDGSKDVVVLFSDKVAGADSYRMQVFFNRGSGTLDAQGLGFPSLAPAAPVGFALINARPEAELEVVMLTATSAFLTKLDATGTTFVTPTQLPAMSGTAITHGDFDGDGVADLAVANSAGAVDIFRGVPTQASP